MSNNFGTSSRVNIGGEDVKELVLESPLISPISNEYSYANPPIPNGDSPGPLLKYVNQYRDFAFQKICPPEYGSTGSIARITGVPANEPDFISDFHFIGIMRAIDDILRPRYEGKITGSTGSVG